MSSTPGVGGAGGMDPLRHVQRDQGVNPAAPKPGFAMNAGAAEGAKEAAGAGSVQDRLVQSLQQAAAQGLSPQQALEREVRQQLDAMAGGSAPAEVVQHVLESIRNDPSLSRILERLERGAGFPQQ